MMNNNSLDFLVSFGWDINTNNKDNKICRTPYDLLEESSDSEWYSIDDALEVEKLNHPFEYDDYIMMERVYTSNYRGKCGGEEY